MPKIITALSYKPAPGPSAPLPPPPPRPPPRAAVPPNGTQISLVADMALLEALPVTALLDVSLLIVQTPPRLYRLNKNGTPGPSGDDERPPANPTGCWDLVMAL